jgi:probable rRNA maturation factor
MPIRYFSEQVEFTIKKEKKGIGDLTYVFCSDEYLLSLNQKFLNHNTLTDIITFDYSEAKTLSGEIYISIERVAENAEKFKVAFEDELHRVMIHGVLHLAGYKDKRPAEKALMRKKEEASLSLRK